MKIQFIYLQLMKNKWEQKQFSVRNTHLLFFFFIVALIIYFPAIRGPMLFDDEHFIQKNRHVHTFNVAEIYTSSVTEGAHISGNFYRPNQQFVFALIYKFFKTTAWPYHMVCVVLHIINAFLLFRLMFFFGFAKVPAAISSFIYLLHPIQTEAISYISGLADPLSVCFMLFGMLVLFYASVAHEKNKYSYVIMAGSIILFLGALFTKENMVIIWPLSVIAFVYLIDQKRLSSRRFIVVSMAVITIATLFYVYLRFRVFNFAETVALTNEKNIYTENLYVRIITFLNILPEYLIMILFPSRLYYEKPYTAYIDMYRPETWISVALVVLFIYLAIKHKKYPRLFLGYCWFCCALIPYSGIIALNAMYLEHWIYAPMLGSVMVIGLLIEYFAKKKFASSFILPLIFIIVTFGIRTFTRNIQWGDLEKFT